MSARRSPPNTQQLHLSRRAHVALMAATALAVAALLLAWGPVSLSVRPHVFVDQRTVWGIPNGWNVLSHLPLLPVGLMGLWRLSQLPPQERLRHVWTAFFIAQLLATLGGMVYHLRPDPAHFMADQIPRSAACALFACAFLAERVDGRFGSGRTIVVALGAVAFGAAWWAATHQWSGRGDLRLLIWLELSPIALIAAGAWTLTGRLLSRQDWLRSQISFVLAQLLDLLDADVFEWTQGLVSGHSLRHVALAACVGWVAWRLGAQRTSKPLPSSARDAAVSSPGMMPEDAVDQTSETSLPDRRLAS